MMLWERPTNKRLPVILKEKTFPIEEIEEAGGAFVWACVCFYFVLYV